MNVLLLVQSALYWLGPMFSFDEDMMVERLSDRCHNPVDSAGGKVLAHRTVAKECGLRGPVLIV